MSKALNQLARAIKLATELERAGFGTHTSNSDTLDAIEGWSDTMWEIVATAAGITPPSATTRAMAVMILRDHPRRP